jgi:hypothetical protein
VAHKRAPLGRTIGVPGAAGLDDQLGVVTAEVVQVVRDAELDIWANDALVSASHDVSWFRFVPSDGDDRHTTALFFRGGQAYLRSEGDTIEYPLSRLPRTDGRPTHVRVLLDRRVPCRTDVELDGELVAATSGGDCADDYNGFVELGLIMSDRSSGELSALYDNFAFTRR